MKLRFLIIVLLFILANTISLYSQPKPPATHRNNVNTTPTQSAPIGTATGLVLTLGAIYTSAKIYYNQKDRKNVH